MSELDLEHGDRAAADKLQSEGKEARTRRRSTSSTSSKSKPKSAPTNDAEEKSLTVRLSSAFSDLADQAEAHQDLELADVLNRRKDAMSQGLMSLTRTVRFLRPPLLLFLIFLEPTLAFWELGGLATRRYIARAQRKQWERQQADVAGVAGNESEQPDYAG